MLLRFYKPQNDDDKKLLKHTLEDEKGRKESEKEENEEK